MTSVRIDDPSRMNVLGLFVASSLRRNLEERGLACGLDGALTIDADGMRATVRFGPEEVVVTREDVKARVTLRAPLSRFVDALIRPGLLRFLRVRIRGNPFFALRALRYLAP